MSVNIVKYPKAVVNGNVATNSKWSAVHHKVGFNYQRTDRDVLQSVFNSATGKLLVQITGTVEGIVGDTCFINSGVHIGIGTISSITTSSTISIFYLNWISLDTSIQAGGFLNFNTHRKNYHILTNILGVEAGAYASIGQSINKPDFTGLITVDCREYLKSLVGYDDKFMYDVRNWRDDSLGGIFNISYSENWTGTTGAFSAISGTNLYYYTNSSKQIQDKYGSNMGEYVPFKNYATPDTRAKFMSDFETPTYFPGFPFSLSFIYSESIADVTVKKKEQPLDVNKQVLSTETFTLDPTQSQGVNRLMVEEGYDPIVKYLDVWLEADLGSGISLPFVAPGYMAAGYVAAPTGPIPVIVPTIIPAIH